MQSQLETRVYSEGAALGISEEKISELLGYFREEFRREPSDFSDLLGVLL